MDGGLFKNVTADAVRIENCTFNNCTFEDLYWEHCDLIQCDFINCTFRSVNLKRADLRGSLFEDISIPNKPRQHWSNVCLFDANANTTRFKHITLEACSLQYLRVDAETILEFYPQGDANNFDGIPLNVPRITSHSYELLRSAQIRQSRLTSLSNATAISEKAAAVFFILIFGLDGSIRSSVYTLILTVFSMTLLAYFCNKHFDGLEMSGELERLPEEFQNCLYFVITTMSTTGYGDVKPKANDAIGITLSIVIMCAGYLLSGTVLARLLNRVDR